MVWDASLPVVTTQLVASPAIFVSNQTATQSVLTTTNLVNAQPYIPTNKPIYFYLTASAAPVGWTAFAVPGDSLLAIEGGVGQYAVGTGGTTTGNGGLWSGWPGKMLRNGNAVNPGCLASIGAALDHTHDWGTIRPYAAVGIFCTKNP